MKKMKILALVMIFAFAALGGAYATLWKDTVTLNTTVNTGNVSLKWLAPDVGDDYHAGSPYDLKDGEDNVAAVLSSGAANPNATDSPSMRRDVGHITLASTALSNDDRDLYVTIDNAYPDYQGEIEAYIVNDGTIPVVIQRISATQADGVTPLPGWITYNICEDNATNYTSKQTVGTTSILGKLLEASEPGGAVASRAVAAPSTIGPTPHDTTDPDLADQNLSNMVKVRISIHIGSTANMLANQNQTINFKLSINGVQWNGVNKDSTGNYNLLDLPNKIVNRFD